MKPDFMRQTDLFDPKNQKFKITIFGAGSLGSFIALNLAKLGFENLTVWDYDFVMDYNLPNQFYRVKDIDKLKVDALYDIIKEFTSIEIQVRKEKFTKDTILIPNLNDLFIVTFDTLEARKLTFDKLKDFNNTVLDVRAGGEEFIMYTINTGNKDEVKKWEESFNIIPTELKCSAKSIIYTNLSISAEVCNIVKKINNNENYPTKLIRHMSQYNILNNQKVVPK